MKSYKMLFSELSKNLSNRILLYIMYKKVIKMVELTIEIPKELEIGVKELRKEELNRIVCKALKEKLSEELMFKIADGLLKESRLTDEIASNFGNELKERVAKRHGL